MQRQQTKPKHKFLNAFSVYSADDSHCRRVYPKDAKAFTDVEALVSLEDLIHSIAESGNRPALKRALYIYLRLRGVL